MNLQSDTKSISCVSFTFAWGYCRLLFNEFLHFVPAPRSSAAQQWIRTRLNDEEDLDWFANFMVVGLPEIKICLPHTRNYEVAVRFAALMGVFVKAIQFVRSNRMVHSSCTIYRNYRIVT